MGGFGPMLGQSHHFNAYSPERITYAMERYTKEAAAYTTCSTAASLTVPTSPATTR